MEARRLSATAKRGQHPHSLATPALTTSHCGLPRKAAVDASPDQLVSYFDGTKQNFIPLFQRPYTWDRDDRKGFWNDLDDCFRSDDRHAHFLGAVVSTPFKSTPVGVSKHLIIDGQQRLTTFALLLAAAFRVIRRGG